MTWLAPFWKWLISLVLHEAVEQVKEEIQKPSTITDEKVDTKFRDAIDADLRDKLRDKQSSSQP